MRKGINNDIHKHYLSLMNCKHFFFITHIKTTQKWERLGKLSSIYRVWLSIIKLIHAIQRRISKSGWSIPPQALRNSWRQTVLLSRNDDDNKSVDARMAQCPPDPHTWNASSPPPPSLRFPSPQTEGVPRASPLASKPHKKIYRPENLFPWVR